ncbi:MAG: flavodoxin domain-containing protein [bacterium]
MKTLIAYGTKYGAAEKIASMIREKISNGEIDVIDLKTEDIQAGDYGRVIIGSAVYMGRIRKEVKGFIDKNLQTLLTKQTGLFLCCMTEEESEQDELAKRVFPAELIEHSEAVVIPGGEFRFDKMNFIERFIVKKISGVRESKSMIDKEKIEQFTEIMKRK